MTPMYCTFLSMSIQTGDTIPEAKTEIGIIVELGPASGGKGASHLCVHELEKLTQNRNVNIPWPQQGMGDGDYMYAFQQVAMPIAQEFNPDLVISTSICSIGNDATVLLTYCSCLWLRRCSRR